MSTCNFYYLKFVVLTRIKIVVFCIDMSLIVRKPVFGVSDQVRHKSDWTVTVTAKLIWVFVFAYAKSRFSHGAAHMLTLCFHLPEYSGYRLWYMRWNGYGEQH